jgi:hypothetical protein
VYRRGVMTEGVTYWRDREGVEVRRRFDIALRGWSL